MAERCGTWVQAGDFDTLCMRPVDHDGVCMPERRELLEQIEHLEYLAHGINTFIIESDKAELPWPEVVARESSGEAEPRGEA